MSREDNPHLLIGPFVRQEAVLSSANWGYGTRTRPRSRRSISKERCE
jgi:hypothetical protein